MAAESLGDAARLAQSGDPARAWSMCRDLIAASPDDADVHTVAGIALQRLGRSADAIAHFEKARNLDAHNPARHGNLAVAFKKEGRIEEALTGFEAALALRPDHPATLSNYASCLIAADRADAAIAFLQRALALSPRLPDAMQNLAVALARCGHHAEAVTVNRQLLTVRTDHREASLNLADELVALDQEAEAEQVVEPILRANPGDVRAANQLALIRERAGAFAQAAHILRGAWMPQHPDHAITVNLARNLIRAGEAEDALTIVDCASMVSPGNTAPLALRAAALIKLERRDEWADLAGIGRFVRVHDIAAPISFASHAAFDDALLEELAAHPSLTFEPEGLVTRKGRQSGDLAEEISPAIAILAQTARRTLEQEVVRLSAMKRDHPFLAACPDRWSLTMWGTILAPGGAVDAHIHAPNWLSGVYYPSFDSRADETEGAFTIGCLPNELGGGGESHIIVPKAGRMITFPSYLWHATRPFGGTRERVSFAFDLVPDGIGRPHALAATPRRGGG